MNTSGLCLSLILIDIELSRGNLIFSNEILFFSREKLKTKVSKSRLANYTQCPLRAYYLKQVCLIVQSYNVSSSLVIQRKRLFSWSQLSNGVLSLAHDPHNAAFSHHAVARHPAALWVVCLFAGPKLWVSFRAHWDEVSNCFHSPSSCHFYTEPSSTLQA